MTDETHANNKDSLAHAENHIEPPSNSEKTLILNLNSFDSRLKKLEEPTFETRLSKIQKNTSFLALIIGVILSLISLSDIFWNKPREELFQDLAEFNKSVNAVANLRQSMIQVQYQSNNPQMILEMNSMVNPQVLANIQYATAILPRIGEHAGIPQLIVLISEAMNIYDWKSAGILVDQAIITKNVAPSLQSEALRYKAKLMFFTGKVQEARKSYEDALNVLRNESAFGINGTRAYVIADWILLEFSLGDCNVSNERIRQFIELVQNPQILPQARSALISSLKGQLSQFQLQNKRCPIPSELQSLG